MRCDCGGNRRRANEHEVEQSGSDLDLFGAFHSAIVTA